MNETPRPWRVAFLAGLILRVAGVFFVGMGDLNQILLDWGFSVHRDGLVSAFGINYGILSYALFGFAASAAEIAPRFWWAPYKLIILLFDLAILLTLWRIMPADRRKWALVLFWLNPWFILQEAFLGFWEAPHILFGLLAVLAIRRWSGAKGWTAAGALLMCSAMFKPQGLVHFIGPLGLYLGIEWLKGMSRAALWLAAGIAGVASATSLLIWTAGGSPYALVVNFQSAFTTMSGVSNGGPGLWRFVAFSYGRATGQLGHVAFVHLPRILLAALSAAAGLACVGIMGLFALRVPLPAERSASARSAHEVVLLVLALGSLVLSQFGVRAHINHSYAPVVLLIPVAVASARMWPLWLSMNVLLGVSHLLVFGIGSGALLPPEGILSRYPAAQPLIQQVTRLPAYQTPDALLALQAWCGALLNRLPVETLVSLLSPIVFIVACLMVRSIFETAKRGETILA